MNTIKKILTLLMLVVVVFSFFISVTQMPAKAQSSPHCNDSDLYCWESFPEWRCWPIVGGVDCTDFVD